jgi:signal transduction histidine kinase
VSDPVEQYAAVSEALRAIAQSPRELQPILDTILGNATRLCRARLGVLILLEARGFRVAARRGGLSIFDGLWPGGSVLAAGPVFTRLAKNRSPVHIIDLATDPSYFQRDPCILAALELLHVRTCLFVPMLRQGELIGAIGILRTRVQAFADRQIGLLTDFAAQATIAFESSRQERQYREVQMQLAHANRVAAMGQLTASIAHELKQPFAAVVIEGNASLRWLTREQPDIEEAKRSIERTIKIAFRANDIIDRIRDLATKNEPRREYLDINDTILEVIGLTHGEAIRCGVIVHTELDQRLPPVQGDRVQLQQVVLNLIVNAIQAMSGPGVDMRELWIRTENIASEGVRIGVQDTGPGLTSDILAHLFEPFFTTKPGGMGMGLKICRSITEAHGGRLWATGCEPQGALFQFTIPVS